MQDMLRDIVDETSRGKYDFMYLRIGKPFVLCWINAPSKLTYRLQTLPTTASKYTVLFLGEDHGLFVKFWGRENITP